MSDTPGKTPSPLPLSHVWYSGRANSLLAAPLHDTETPSTFSRLLCLILSYHVSTAISLVVTHICFSFYPPLFSSYWICFFVRTVSPLFHISYAAVSVAPYLHIRCHACTLSLSSGMTASSALIDLIIPCIFHLLLSPSSYITDSFIIVILLPCWPQRNIFSSNFWKQL